MNAPLDSAVTEKRDRLLDLLRSYGSVAVAFSGGVDSTVVAQAAHLACGERALAVTAVSASLASGELEEACELARRIGIRHEVVETQEFQDPNYLRNSGDRCYFCKSELYTQLELLAPRFGMAVIVNGANVDDQGDYRPGMQAAAERAVRSPLLEVGLTKAEVRQLAQAWDLPVWDKPAAPCLSSRIAHGLPVTPERVARVDQAEAFLKKLLGTPELRVRHEMHDLARIEVPLEVLPRLVEPAARAEITAKFQQLGFKFVTLDLQGFRSGSLNAVLPVETLWQSLPSRPAAR